MSVHARYALLLAMLTVACGGRAEEVVLRGYFDTCAVADDVALANIALVALDPERDGVVGSFRITAIDPEVQQPGSAHPAAVRLSLSDPLRPHDGAGARLVSEIVRLRAQIHRDGRTTEQPMDVTLARAETGEIAGRWVVVRLVLAGRTLPEASSAPRSGISP